MSGTNGQVIMAGDGAEVSWNVGAGGIGGILIDETASYFEMSGNHAKITRNQGGVGWAGGGIELWGAGTIGVMSGEYAEISGNYSGNDGGGVYVASNAQFTMSGAASLVSGNKANNDGGGIDCVNGDFTMKGGEISGNSSANHDGNGTWLHQFGVNSSTQKFANGVHGVVKINGISGATSEYDYDVPNGGPFIGVWSLYQIVATVIKVLR
jgi:hypothetical protein